MKKPSIPNLITAVKSCNYKEFAKDICYDFVGSCLFALGFYTFAEQGGFAPGGLTGISLMIRYFTGAPLGTLTLLLNLPIILICAPLLGRRFFIKSMRTMLICTFVLDVI
ncbi:MAG: YitT family protein, partial [Faecalibacterium sp.]